MSVPTEHDDEPSASLPAYPSIVLQRNPLDNGTANSESPVSWKYVVCVHVHKIISFQHSFFLHFFPLWALKLLENLCQKNLAPPVPDRNLLVSYVSAGRTQSPSSPAFISSPTRPETLCSLHTVPMFVSLPLPICLGLSSRVSVEKCLPQKLLSMAVGGKNLSRARFLSSSRLPGNSVSSKRCLIHLIGLPLLPSTWGSSTVCGDYAVLTVSSLAGAESVFYVCICALQEEGG